MDGPEKINSIPIRVLNESLQGKESPIRDAIFLAICSQRIPMQLCPLIAFTPRECRFECEAPIKWGCPILCVFYHAHTDRLQHVSARTHWCRKVKDKWQVGAFLDADLDRIFAEAMRLDRRTTLRYEVHQPATLLTSMDEEIPVSLQDYSMDGVCLSAPATLPQFVGEEIRIRLPQDDTPIDGRVAWQLSTAEEGQSVGVKISGAKLSWFIAVGSGRSGFGPPSNKQ